MRDIIIFIIVFGSLPFIFKRPAIGVMMFAWISLMNPHRLTYGAAYDFPFALLLSGCTLISMLMSKDPKSLPSNRVLVALIIFFSWTTITSFFALEPDLAWKEWSRVFKTFFMVLVTLAVIRTELDIKQLTMVITASLAFYGLKGGLFTIGSGGHYRVQGPEGTYITDNNCMALAMVQITPLIWYHAMQEKRKWFKLGFQALTALTLVSAMGSYSRGALLATGAMLGFLWLKSRNKVATGMVLLALAPAVLMLMPDQWMGRMQSIDNYQEDGSAMGRINAWTFAYNVAKSHLLGGGYIVFTFKQFQLYAPNPQDFHVAHSIYFQVLGEHGFIGLGLFLLFMVLAWRSGSRILAATKDKAELKWARDLAAMCQVSLIGYAVGGAFLSMAYYDLYYYIVAIMLLLEKWLALQPKEAPPPPVRQVRTRPRPPLKPAPSR
ncbi:putative O-glycosylation ligase, exosortase A system-associated [Pseudoduganella ginsengisoli]|uniref:putative O-glycosylation ligase, exosortase A system-associated n=1 Tax=Pseudoduganella ginsengisoli TaxID=1462440 RepID=UPI0014794DD0